MGSYGVQNATPASADTFHTRGTQFQEIHFLDICYYFPVVDESSQFVVQILLQLPSAPIQKYTDRNSVQNDGPMTSLSLTATPIRKKGK